MRWPRSAMLLASCLLALAAGGCSTGLKLYINPLADPGSYTKIAFLPFGNLSPDAFAPGRVSRALESAMLATNRYSIVSDAQFAPLLGAGGVDPNKIAADPDKLKAVTDALGVTGILRGTVTEYRTIRAGSEEYPLVAFDVELLDGPTGNVVWRASLTGRGRSSMALLGMSGERSFTQVTEGACARAVAALRAKGF
jgi:hypothetical protein